MGEGSGCHSMSDIYFPCAGICLPPAVIAPAPTRPRQHRHAPSRNVLLNKAPGDYARVSRRPSERGEWPYAAAARCKRQRPAVS